MSLLGKILVILNILAAAGFAAVAAMDYGKRAAWSYAVFRWDLAIDGLPLNDAQAGEDDVPTVNKISDDTLKDIFAQAGGVLKTPDGKDVNTQEREVARVKAALESKVGQLGTNAQKARFLAFTLANLAKTYADRDRLTSVIAGKDDEAANQYTGLLAEFDAAFDEALKGLRKVPQTGGEPKSQNEAPYERRSAIASLLFRLLDPLEADAAKFEVPSRDLLASNGYKRYLVVVGPEAAIPAINGQARALARMTQDMIAAMGRERNEFVVAHRDLIEDLRSRARFLKELNARVAEDQARVTAQELLIAQRKQDIVDYQKGKKDKDGKWIVQGLDPTREDTKKTADVLREMSQKLFETRLAVLKAARENAQYEDEVNKLAK